MVEPLNLRDLTWALTALFKATLLFYLFWRRIYRLHPLFCAYIILTILQTLIAAWTGRYWDVHSMRYFNVAWGVQAVVVCARWMAVVEIARRVLQGYSGIWKLASGLLFLGGLVTLGYAMLTPQHRWDLIVLNADRAIEMSIAGFVVGMLAFASYYRVAMTHLERQLSMGFGLFSCSWIISNSIVQQNRAGAWWQFFQIFAFLATLVVWVNAVRKPVEELPQRGAHVLSPEKFAELSAQVSGRLHDLNDRLDHLLRSKDSRT